MYPQRKLKRTVLALKDRDLIERLETRAEKNDRSPTAEMRRILDKALPKQATA
jgi:plasmid stability protein